MTTVAPAGASPEVAALAQALHRARCAAQAMAQPDTPWLDVAAAYAVQHAGLALREAASERRCGVKMGFTSRAKMAQMGVHEMIIGQLTDAMQVEDGGTFAHGRAIHPRVEPELAMLVGRDLHAIEQPAQLASAVEAVAPAMEIIDSRYADFRFSLPAVVADNTSGCGFVLGPWQRVPPRLDNLGIAMRVDGRVRQAGSSAAILGDPWRALHAAWVLARRHGLQVGAGSVLLAGAATAAEPLQAGVSVMAEVAGLRRVGFRVEASA
jgi:2-oxo-3-hexenedioate decarboxylase